MDIKGLTIKKPKLNSKDNGDTLSKAVKMHNMHKETFDEAWQRVLNMKNTDVVTEKLLKVKEAMEAGEIERSSDKYNRKFSKSEALEYYEEINRKEMDKVLQDMVDNTPDNYHLVQTEKALNRVVDIVSKEEEIVFDVETTGTDVTKDYIVGHVLSAIEHNLHFYIPTKHKTDKKQLDNDLVNRVLKPVYENDAIAKVAHNFKFDYKMLEREGITVDGRIWDTQEAMKLLNENEKSYALKPLVDKYLKIPSKTYGELFGQVGFDTIDLDTALAYASKDGEVTHLLKEFQIKHLKKMPSLYNYVVDVEMPLIKIVAEMEQVGFPLDTEYAEEYAEVLRKETKESWDLVQEELTTAYNRAVKRMYNSELPQKGDIVVVTKNGKGVRSEVIKEEGDTILIRSIDKEYGQFPVEQGLLDTYAKDLKIEKKKPIELKEEINLNSPQQLKLAIESLIGKEIQDTNADNTLKPLAKEYPLINELLAYREKERLLSNYFDSLPKLVNPDTGRVHSQLNQNGAKTGRLSAGGGGTFNIQNIPPEARPMFLAPEGYIIAGADFSAQEVRIIASESQEKVLLDAFKHDRDPYATLASKFFNKPYEECYKNDDGSDTKEREMMKVVLLSSMYGASKYGLSGSLGITIDEAEDFRRNFFNTYKNIDKFIKRTQNFVRRNGFVWIGDEERKRRLPIARSNNPMHEGEKRRALRQGPNARIQGLASIQTKRTMIELDKVCKERGWSLFYTIHDEIAVLMPEDATKEDIDKFEEIMTQTYLLDGVENKADVEIQKVWSQSKTPEEWFKEA